MPAWRVYYGDESTFSSNDGGPENVPTLNVQAIVVAPHLADPPGPKRQVLQGFDYYWWDEDKWFGGDLGGLVDYLHRPGWKRVLAGRSIPHEEWVRIVTRATHDPDFEGHAR